MKYLLPVLFICSFSSEYKAQNQLNNSNPVQQIQVQANAPVRNTDQNVNLNQVYASNINLGNKNLQAQMANPPAQIQNEQIQVQGINLSDNNDNNFSNIALNNSGSDGSGLSLPSLNMPKLNLKLSVPSRSIGTGSHHHSHKHQHKVLKRLNKRLLKMKDHHKKRSFAVALCWIP
ncbi:MAG: hypothetical protein ACHQRM_05540 [Bacteroidia bacterium]